MKTTIEWMKINIPAPQKIRHHNVTEGNACEGENMCEGNACEGNAGYIRFGHV